MKNPYPNTGEKLGYHENGVKTDIWDDLTMACPLCGAAPNVKCKGINVTRTAIHEDRVAANQAEQSRRAELYPEMLAALKNLHAYLYGLGERIEAEEYGRLKIEYLIIFDLIAKCEGKNGQT